MHAHPQCRSRELITFFVCAYAISWVIWLPLILGRGGLGVVPLELPLYYGVSVGTAGPTIAALITQRLLHGTWRAFPLWTSWRPMALAVLAGSAALLLACFVAAIAATQSGFGLWDWAALVQIPYLFLPNLLGGPLGEEPGWRGFALPRLQACLRPLTASIVLGFLWANWHLPLLLVHFTSMPYWLYVPLLVSASVIITHGFNLSGGSSIVAIYLHGLLNVGIGVILNDFLGKATIRQSPSEEAVIVGSFVGVAILLALATRGRLGLKTAQEEAERHTRPAANLQPPACHSVSATSNLWFVITN